MRNDAEEYGGKLNVIDDLVKQNNEYNLPTSKAKPLN